MTGCSLLRTSISTKLNFYLFIIVSTLYYYSTDTILLKIIYLQLYSSLMMFIHRIVW